MPQADAIIAKIKAGELDGEFTAMYGTGPHTVERQRRRYIETLRSFESCYGAGRELAIYSAPGRTEIGGNHTDHQNGAVLAAAVSLDIIAVIARNEDEVIRVRSQGFEGEDAVRLAELAPIVSEFGRSSALVRGVAAGLRQRGGAVGGFDAYTTSDVLKGSGLSSSAAFEVCMAAVLNGEYSDGRFTPVELGQVSQYAENVFFGKPSGLMDQTASAVGSVIAIDFEDPASPLVERIDIDLASTGHSLVITDTGGDHADLTHEYAAVREDMEKVAACFDKPVLRQVDERVFYEVISSIRGQVGDRALLRAIHFFGDTRRAAQMAQRLKAGDFEGFLELVNAAGHSAFEYNQNAYSAADSAHQGLPLGLALSQAVMGGRGARRLQGGGFAGTIQAFVPGDLLEAYCARLNAVFGSDACHVLTIRQSGCRRVV